MVMEEDHKSKHMCKFCSKIFPCGRSLGGHMRSHLINISSTEKKLPPLTTNTTAAATNLLVEDGGGPSRKFSDRISCEGSPRDTSLADDKLCKECGKAFQSWKALFGHMKCHSTIGKEEDTYLSSSDNEAAALCKKKRSHRPKRYTNSSPNLSPYASSSEQEEVALSLILLSMDCTNSPLQSHNTTSESNNKTGDVKEERERERKREREFRAPRSKKTNQNLNTGCSESEVNSPKTLIKKNAPFSKKKKTKTKTNTIDSNESEMNFRCIICNKAFPSYQALGGHRASHKKFKGCCAPTTPKPTENLQQCKKSKDHECPICLKVFPSGQALGGHKRSHLITDHQTINTDHRLPVSIPQVRHFLDLNLPAPIEEDCNELKPWWITTTHHHHHEPLLSLLSS